MMASIGLLLIRFVFGLTFAGHGAQKLFGWFGGHGLQGTAGWMESIGLNPGKVMAFAAGAGELAGGILFALGLWTPLAALLMVVSMMVAIVKVHGPNGYWITQNGYEYNLAIIVVAIGVALIGPGQYALDTILFR
jgi:putative oxidoreductase